MSTIISTTIDEAFPVAGQDNDSQGFRDNFTIIKDNFEIARGEITALETNAAVKNAANVYSYNLQSQTVNKETTLTKGTGIITSSLLDVSFNNGNFVDVDVRGGGQTLKVSGWPEVTESEAYAEVVIAMTPNTSSSGYTVTLTSENASGVASTVLTDGNGIFGGSNIVTMPNTTSQYLLVKMMTWDRGDRVYLQYLGTFTEI